MAWIAPAVARDTRVCVYDRAGRGWSDAAQTPPDAVQISTDLHTLLARAHVPGPYVLAGHSFGGLIAQKLLAGGNAAAAVAIDPGQIKGVKPVPFAQIRSGFPVLSNPGNKKRSVALSKKQFRYAFGNAISEAESGDLYDAWSIPGPGKPLFEASTANFSASSPAAVDTTRRDRGPLLIIGGGKDHTVPEVVAKAAHALYSGSGAVTDYHAFADRGHSLVLTVWERPPLAGAVDGGEVR